MNINTINADCEKWFNSLKEEELAPRTIEQYRTSIKKFADYLAKNEIKEINKDVVIEYKNDLANEYKTSTVNIRLIALNKFFKYINADDLAVKTLKQQRQTTNDETLTIDECNRLIRYCRSHGKEKLSLLIRLFVGTGIRYSELEYITVDSISKKKKGIVKVQNKGKERTITIPTTILNELRSYCNANDIRSGIIFHGRDKTQIISKTYLWQELKDMTGKARGIKKSKVHPHAFRHLFAKTMLENGVPITELADLLGHSSIETTRIYTRSTSSDKQSTVSKCFDKNFKK